jgi:CubicO group peptidase (beta-lactamase class C family)
MPFDAGRDVLDAAVRARTFPGVVAEVGSATSVLWTDALGTRQFDDGAAVTRETLYDLASLTKPIATTTMALAAVDEGLLRLDDPVSRFFPDWGGLDREDVKVRDLLEHSSGLPARLVDPPPATRREFEHDICRIALEYAPRSQSLYSDLGFILLGFLVADRFERSLDAAFSKRCDDPLLTFRPAAELRAQAAPTEPMTGDPRRGRLLVGEVHDNYAAALGGVAGHAGLFGTAAGVGRFARMVLDVAAQRSADGGEVRRPFSTERFLEMTTRSAVPGSSRALGWDTMLPTSSCGTRMSESAFGHVGFTGTSLWIDPARDRYFVLLANRVCGGGTVDEMREVRRSFHDALGDV